MTVSMVSSLDNVPGNDGFSGLVGSVLTAVGLVSLDDEENLETIVG